MAFQYVGKPVARRDARGKVTGATKYMTDLTFPEMLWGKIVRAGVPHARILAIDTTEAEQYPGVHVVVTAKDVPGLNGYGIILPDQPVFAWDKVRFQGEAIAGVVAKTKEIAAAAAKKIKVKYEELPGVFDPREGLQKGAPKVHDGGNLHLETHVTNGDVEKAFQEADIIVENEYSTSMQMQAYLEVEGGVGIYRDGELTLWCGSQYPTQDQEQLSKVMALPKEKIRIISNPVGGGFGGKDDLVVQAQLAVMAYKAGKPVKVVQTREESCRASWKRHPMYIAMKTAAKKDGTLLANRVEIIGDTGAYAGLGGPVVNLAIEHACGAYRVPNVDIHGYCVFTNNSLCSAMRGFGVPQVTFAMENQLEILAAKLGLDPLEIRRKNCLQTGEQGALGHTLSLAMGTAATLAKAGEMDLWKNRGEYKKQAPKWKKRGIGLATSIQGAGLGNGIPDYSAADITLHEQGRFLVAVGCPEIGQGNSTAFAQIAAEALGCSLAQIEVVTGDTACTPDSGITAASRTVYAAGNAILAAAEAMKEKMLQLAGEYWQVQTGDIALKDCCAQHENKRLTYAQLAKVAAEQDLVLKSHGHFEMPNADKSIEGAHGLPHLLYSAVTHLALVEVDTLTGAVDVLKAVCIPDAGKVINLQGIEAQAEGGTVMGMGYALLEQTLFDDGRLETDNFSTYLIPTALDCPAIETHPVEVPEKSGPFGAKGIGECVGNPITPAIINAIYDAVGVRVRHLPADLEKVFFSMENLANGGVKHE